MSDAAKKKLLKEMIRRAVRGEPSPWPIDPEFKVEGTYEDRFKCGDYQILLWAIDHYAQSGQPIPKWAAEALEDRLFRAVTGELGSWDEAFGSLYAKGTQRRRIYGLSRMLDVLFLVRQLHKEGHPIDDHLFERVGKELGVGGKTTVKKLYSDAQNGIRHFCEP
jgi:hypothetical protein